MKVIRFMGLLAGIAMGWTASAQSWDASGNGQLNGTYYFRQVAYQLDNSNSGTLNDMVSLYGTISFNGSGSYSLSATEVDYSQQSAGPITFSGTYSIAASGLGFMSSPLSTGDKVYGLVSNGVFIGSSTDNGSGYNDLFIAAPSSANTAVQSGFKGTYSLAYMNFPSIDPGGLEGEAPAYDAQFQISPNGSGQIGNVSVTGYEGTNLTKAFTVSESGVKYTVSNGAVALSFPTSNNTPVTGEVFLYTSPDGNFVFGGSQYGFDMFVGVRTPGATPSFGGLYYQAGLDEDESNTASGYVLPDSYFGSLYALSSGDILAHQRVLSLLTTSSAYDYTYADSYSLNSNGTSDDPSTGQHYVYGAFSSGGTIRIGFGNASVQGILGISVALAAPPASSFSGSGVYLNPTGVQNAGSFALFTAGIAPGEFILLNGTGLANTATASPAFPTTLGGVKVLINNNLAPIYSVSPTLLKVLVPYEVAANSFASIQVVNNNATSNAVSVFTSMTAPGVFTIPPDGLAQAAAEDANFNVISDGTNGYRANPAQIGQTIAVYLTGLGAVNPPIVDAGVGSSTAPYNLATNTISVDFGGTAATSIPFAGLTPTAIGLYQINVTVPTGAPTGDVYFDVGGPDSYTSEAGIYVGSGSSIEAGGSPRAIDANGHRIRPRRPRSVNGASQISSRRKLPGTDVNEVSTPLILKPLAR